MEMNADVELMDLRKQLKICIDEKSDSKVVLSKISVILLSRYNILIDYKDFYPAPNFQAQAWQLVANKAGEFKRFN